MSEIVIRSDRSIITIEDKVYDGEVEVEVTHEYSLDDTYIYINKDQAEQIVNHLIKVFDITPEGNK